MENKSELENQTVEWKCSWNDEYLKWLCGYANVDGGTLYIGVNDDGYVVGVDNCEKLIESFPNKINDKLGIVASIRTYHVDRQGINIRYGDDVPADVESKLANKYARGLINSSIIQASTDAEIKKYEKAILKLEQENPIHLNALRQLDYISITIERYPFAISCDGKYYKRSGSTLRILQGFELQNFLLERAGKTWDSVPIPGVSVDDLDRNALNAFRTMAVANKRLSESEVNVPDSLLLRNLKLYDGDYLTRAAILLFHPDPEQFVTGAYIKIAFFAPADTYGMNSAADIIYQDDIHGPLITQADKTVEILYSKYFKALITYEKLQRIETYMLSMGIIRELILNPINHKDYSRGVPIQISVFEDHIEIYNTGTWPTSIPLDDTLYQKHESIPYNPKIADVFYRSGEIESWGRGFLKVRLECEKTKAALPTIKQKDSGITVIATACEEYRHILFSKRAEIIKQAISRITVQSRETVDWMVEVEGVPIIIESTRNVSDEEREREAKRKKAYEHMLDVCSKELNDKEKMKLYPLIQYFETHDEINRTTAEKLCGKGTTTTVSYLNRLIEFGVLEKQKESVAIVYRLTGM